jgi:hypothetical protein
MNLQILGAPWRSFSRFNIKMRNSLQQVLIFLNISWEMTLSSYLKNNPSRID